MKISEFSSRFNMSPETVRYYVNEGLLVPHSRNNRYDFTENDVTDMEYILKLKSFHFPLHEVRRILVLKRLSNFGSSEELDDYINSMGKSEEGEDDVPEDLKKAEEQIEQAKIEASEELAEKLEESIQEEQLEGIIDIDITSQYVQLTLQGSLLFDSGSVVLKDESLPVLDKIGVMLERYSESTIEIEGHTDNVPMSGAKYSNNDELSGGRSLSVFNYLMGNTNLDPAMVKHSGRGEYMPIADNSTPEGRAMNRRVEIRIFNSLSSY